MLWFEYTTPICYDGWWDSIDTELLIHFCLIDGQNFIWVWILLRGLQEIRNCWRKNKRNILFFSRWSKNNRIVNLFKIITYLSLGDNIIGYNFTFPSLATQTWFATWVITVILLCFLMLLATEKYSKLFPQHY